MFCDSDGNIRLKPLKPSKHFVKKRTKAVLSEKKRIQTSKNGSVTFNSRLCQDSLCRQFGNGQFDREMVSQCTRQVTNFATYRTGKPSIEKRQMVQISTVPKDNAEPRFCFLSSVTLSFVNAFRRFRRRLLRSCDCDIEPTGCSCCKKCFACLDFLQVECCSCVGLCPSPNATLAAGAPQKSVVADFEESVPQLWEALTDGEDLQGRWQKYTYPVDVKTTTTTATKKEEIDVTAIQETALKSDVSTQNCTVVFLSQCMAEKKCEISCRSMGASAYRWFTDGCCECVGHGCVSYGINESRCEMCSYDDDDDQLLPENISDEELERLEKLENLNNEESSSTPEEQVLAEPPTPPKKSKKTSTIVDV